jgi:hypothetical protein
MEVGKDYLFVVGLETPTERYFKGKYISVTDGVYTIFTEGKNVDIDQDDLLLCGEDESEIIYPLGSEEQVSLQQNPHKMEMILLHAIQNNIPSLVEYISSFCDLSFMYKDGTAIELTIGTPMFDILLHKRAAFSQKYALKKAIDTYDYPLNLFNVSQITDMSQLFKKFDFQGDLSTWDVSKVENMREMFAHSTFHGNISTWDVSNVKDMSAMFFKTDFQEDLSTWDVSKVENMREMFAHSTFHGDISKWDVSNVKYMSAMFFKTDFQGDLSSWDVSNVLSMLAMFRSSTFQGDISTWDISTVKDMREMFVHSEYNRDLSTWNIYGKFIENMFKHCPIDESYKPMNVKPTFDCVALVIGHSDFNADTDYKHVPEGCTITTILADKPGDDCYANTRKVIPFVTKMFQNDFDKSPQQIRDTLNLLGHKGAISKNLTQYYNREWAFYHEEDEVEFGCVLIFTRERIDSLYEKEIRKGTFVLSKETLLLELFKTYTHPLLLDFGCSKVNGSHESVRSFKKKGIYGGSRSFNCLDKYKMY